MAAGPRGRAPPREVSNALKAGVKVAKQSLMGQGNVTTPRSPLLAMISAPR